MNASEIIKNIEAEQLKAEAPQFSVGDTVKVYGKIKEGNRERIQVFEGTVIKKQGGSNRTTFTVRKISNGVGVEKTWPLQLKRPCRQSCKGKRVSKIICFMEGMPQNAASLFSNLN